MRKFELPEVKAGERAALEMSQEMEPSIVDFIDKGGSAMTPFQKEDVAKYNSR